MAEESGAGQLMVQRAGHENAVMHEIIGALSVEVGVSV